MTHFRCILTLWVVSAGCTGRPWIQSASMSSPCLYPVGSREHVQAQACIRVIKTCVAGEQKKSQTQPTFRYVSPRSSYSNLHSVLCRMLMVDWLTWILSAGGDTGGGNVKSHLRSSLSNPASGRARLLRKPVDSMRDAVLTVSPKRQ